MVRLTATIDKWRQHTQERPRLQNMQTNENSPLSFFFRISFLLQNLLLRSLCRCFLTFAMLVLLDLLKRVDLEDKQLELEQAEVM